MCMWFWLPIWYLQTLLATDRWFCPCTPVYSNNKTVRHDIANILLKVALNTIDLSLSQTQRLYVWCLLTTPIKKCFFLIYYYININFQIIFQANFHFILYVFHIFRAWENINREGSEIHEYSTIDVNNATQNRRQWTTIDVLILGKTLNIEYSACEM